MELGEWQDRFEAIGVNVVAMTYDDPAVLSVFASGLGLGYTLLSDPDGEYMGALGIRNEEYGPGHRGFGIPHPGIMLIDTSRTVLYKAAVEDYRARPPFDALFDAVSTAVGETSGVAAAAESESPAVEETESAVPKSCTRRRAARRSLCKKANL